ncbi:MAG: efflux RND transporter periplasmic adaptor subunit [Gemmatimonadales bacterium]|nr:MAG: efflux RND transporter periplasmic adaptor subunit [Gemmatimonadales bacterium]
MSFSKRTLTVTTVILVLGAVGVGIWWRLRPEPEEGAATSSEGEAPVEVAAASSAFAADMPQPVMGVPAVRDTLWITVNANGQAEAFRRTAVTAQTEGVIQSIPVRENGRVAQGRPILQIDTLELALAVAEARAALADAEAQFQARILFDDELTDPEVRRRREEVARSASGLNAAEVRLRQAELELQRATVRAPFGGRIADLQAVRGAWVTPGTELMTVVQLDPIKVEVQVLEAELGYLREGRRAQVTFSAFPGETFEGRIESINPVVDPDQRTGRVTVHLSNPEGRIKPGMYAEVFLDAESFPDRILVPRGAILERGEGRRRTMLFVYEGDAERGLAKWRYVTTGRESDRLVEIVPSDEGVVEPGEVVLVDGHHYLAHDTPVRLVENVASEGGRPGR